MATQYRDNYPYNIEAPQRVYVQYSQDIEFDYSTGKYPLGETFEGFIWETIYNPLPHSYGDLLLGRHVWMRWRIGEKDNWTLPMRFTDSILNIETTQLEQILGTNQSRFRFKYIMNSGEIIYSEYMIITNGIDGRGITNSRIVDVNLYLDYSDNTTQNLGRVVGYNGNGFPSDTLNPGEIAYIDADGNIIWTQFIDVLDLNLSGTSPIEYLHGVISHNNDNGNKHVPIGGILDDVLTTNGLGSYTWKSASNLIATYITDILPSIYNGLIDDTAGTGDVNVTWSADKIETTFNNLSTFGIKYSVPLYSDLASLTGMDEADLAVITADLLYPNRPVYKYVSGTWISFFDLDAAHNHNTLYYTKTELNTSLAGGLVHWDNITNKPTLYDHWNIAGNGGGTGTIYNNGTLNIVGGNGAYTFLSGNTLTISATGTSYSNGSGLDLTGTVFSHSDTSSIGNTTNGGTYVLQNLTFDTFGHVLTSSSINLNAIYTPSNNFYTLTRGTGLTGSNFNPISAASTFAVDFAGTGSANTVARSDHYHSSSVSYTSTNAAIPGAAVCNAKKIITDGGPTVVAIDMQYVYGAVTISAGAMLGQIISGYRPSEIALIWAYADTSVIVIKIDVDGVFYVANVFGPGFTANIIKFNCSYLGN